MSERIDHGTKFADVAPYVEDRKMHAQSTVVNFTLYFILLFLIQWAKTHNFDKVTLDVGTGKAIPAANVFNQKKMMHGTMPK